MTVMSILARPPKAEAAETSPHVKAPRSGDRPRIDPLGTLPGVLLPAGSTLAPAPASTPARALALDALHLLRRLRDTSRRPDRWSSVAFNRDVELVRRHLAPLRTRAALAGSYGREAFHLVPDLRDDADPGPVRVAYALRWLELGESRAMAGTDLATT